MDNQNPQTPSQPTQQDPMSQPPENTTPVYNQPSPQANEPTPRNPMVILVGLLAVLLIPLALYFLLKPMLTPSPQALPVIESIPTSSPTPTTQVMDDQSAIRKAVALKHGKEELELEIVIDNMDAKYLGRYALGTVREKNAAEGSRFLAVKTIQGWVVVHIGQGPPSCIDVKGYNFPKEIVSACLEANGQMTTFK